MKVSNFRPDKGGFSTSRVMCFWSLLAFGRSLLDSVGSFVSRSFDIVVVGCGALAFAPCDVTFVRISEATYIFPPLRPDPDCIPLRPSLVSPRR